MLPSVWRCFFTSLILLCLSHTHSYVSGLPSTRKKLWLRQIQGLCDWSFPYVIFSILAFSFKSWIHPAQTWYIDKLRPDPVKCVPIHCVDYYFADHCNRLCFAVFHSQLVVLSSSTKGYCHFSARLYTFFFKTMLAKAPKASCTWTTIWAWVYFISSYTLRPVNLFLNPKLLIAFCNSPCSNQGHYNFKIM